MKINLHSSAEQFARCQRGRQNQKIWLEESWFRRENLEEPPQEIPTIRRDESIPRHLLKCLSSPDIEQVEQVTLEGPVNNSFKNSQLGIFEFRWFNQIVIGFFRAEV